MFRREPEANKLWPARIAYPIRGKRLAPRTWASLRAWAPSVTTAKKQLVPDRYPERLTSTPTQGLKPLALRRDPKPNITLTGPSSLKAKRLLSRISPLERDAAGIRPREPCLGVFGPEMSASARSHCRLPSSPKISKKKIRAASRQGAIRVRAMSQVIHEPGMRPQLGSLG